jgi:hypothetical protein
MKTICFILSLLILPLCNYGQSILDVEGTWQIKAGEASFCTIVMMEDESTGQFLAVLEGMKNKHPFKIRCRVEQIPQRQAIALYELADEKGNTDYESNRPLLCFHMKTGGTVVPLWCQIDMTKKESNETKNKTLKVKKITIPNYKKTYQFVPFEDPTAALVN